MLASAYAARSTRPVARSPAHPGTPRRGGAAGASPGRSDRRADVYRSADDLCLERRCQLLPAGAGGRGVHQFRGRGARGDQRLPRRGPAADLSRRRHLAVGTGGDRWRAGGAGRWLAHHGDPSRRRPDYPGTGDHRCPGQCGAQALQPQARPRSGEPGHLQDRRGGQQQLVGHVLRRRLQYLPHHGAAADHPGRWHAARFGRCGQLRRLPPDAPAHACSAGGPPS